MKNQLRSLLMVAVFTAPYAAADDFNQQAINQQNISINQQDVSFAFGDSATVSFDTGQMDLLSNQEMITTEGRWMHSWYHAQNLGTESIRFWRNRGTRTYLAMW